MRNKQKSLITITLIATTTMLSTLPAPLAGAQDTIAPEVDAELAPYQQAAEAYVRAMSTRNTAMLNRIMDYGALFDRAAEYVNLGDAALYNQARQQFITAGPERIGGSWINALGPADTITFIKLRMIDDEPRALCRLLGEDGLNYQDLYFIKDDNGRIHVSDFFSMFGGEDVSESSGKAMALAATNDPKLRATTQVMQQMFAAQNAGNYQEALNIYNKQPEDIKNNKTILLQRLVAAAEVSLDEVTAASDHFAKLFPDNPAADLHRIDPLIVAEEYDAAIEAIRSLQQHVEGDPYLDSMVADVYLTAGDLDKSKEAANIARDKDRTLIDPVWTLTTIALQQEDWSAVAEHLTTLVHNFGIELNDLHSVPEYAGFVQSEEYSQWLSDVVMVWDLQDADKELLDDHRTAGRALINKYLPDIQPETTLTGTQLDQLLDAYIADTAADKPAPPTVVSGISVMLGDLAVTRLDAEWVTFTNAYVNNVFALYHETGGTIELPFHTVAEVIEAEPGSSICEKFLATFTAKVGQ